MHLKREKKALKLRKDQLTYKAKGTRAARAIVRITNNIRTGLTLKYSFTSAKPDCAMAARTAKGIH